MNDTTPQPPAEPTPPAPEAPTPPPAYTPPPLPPGYEQHYRPIYQPQQPAHAKGPSNDTAVASVITACASVGFLIISAGVLAPLTLISSIIAIVLGHVGKQNVDRGKTTQNRDLAVAGFWTGIGATALSIIAIIAWIVILIVALNSDITWTDDNGQMHHWSMD